MCQCVRFLPLIPPRVTKNMYQVDIHSRTMEAAGQMQQYICRYALYVCTRDTHFMSTCPRYKSPSRAALSEVYSAQFCFSYLPG